MKQTTVRLPDTSLEQMQRLTEWLGLPTNTAVLIHAIDTAVTIQAARRNLSDSDFVGFLAEMYRPIE